MNRIAKRITALTLALALLLAQLALAEASDALTGIYDALLAEGSDYSEAKAMYAEYFPDAVFEETLQDDGFTIAVSGSEYMDGSWTFTRDGDCLTATFAEDDMNGVTLALNVIDAVGAYYGMNTSLIKSYANGLGALGIESGNFSIAEDEAAGSTTLRINIAGPWDMKELDEMALDEASLPYEPLSGEDTSMGGSIGKMMMIANGSADDVTILLGEYGGLDALAYRSMVNVVSVLKPNGWEDFTAHYAELAEAEGAGWSVKLGVDDATVAGIIDDANEDYEYALIHFGA